MKKSLSSYHLSIDPTRESLFDFICLDIEDSKGEKTLGLEDLAIVNTSKELCSLDGKFSKLGEDSGYSLSVGLNTYKLKYGKNYIGRFDDNDIIVNNDMVSRRHCCIVVHSDERMEIFDTASKNGTRVNGQKVQRYVLKPGDEITLGRSHTLMISAY
jgi:pSer/pThr/pTyr-binding forkhead associated (FHA) protein